VTAEAALRARAGWCRHLLGGLRGLGWLFVADQNAREGIGVVTARGHSACVRAGEVLRGWRPRVDGFLPSFATRERRMGRAWSERHLKGA
jgi:hypothetical protein